MRQDRPTKPKRDLSQIKDAVNVSCHKAFIDLKSKKKVTHFISFSMNY